MMIVFSLMGFFPSLEAKPPVDLGRVDLTPITSPNYPEKYGSNTDETFDRSVEEDSKILITFTDFDIENDPYCRWDWVTVVDGDGTVLLPKSCGSGIPDPIASKTNRITVEFLSDFSITKGGFKAELKAVPGSSSGCKCGIPNRVHRIVGGTDTEVNEYPW